MLFWTRMGWLVPVGWLVALGLSGQVAPGLADDVPVLGVAGTAFFITAAVSATVLFLLGAVLNRHKVPTTIRPLGRERQVMWGTHTFYFFPIEHWAVAIPVLTVVIYPIMRVV